MSEVFVPVKKFPSISVSCSGALKCHMPNCSALFSGHQHYITNGKKEELLRPYFNGKSYHLSANIFVCDIEKPYPLNMSRYKSLPLNIDVIILKTFIKRPKDHFYINHIDGNENNNKIDNLQWSQDKGRRLKRIIIFDGPTYCGMKAVDADFLPKQMYWKYMVWN